MKLMNNNKSQLIKYGKTLYRLHNGFLYRLTSGKWKEERIEKIEILKKLIGRNKK